MDALPPANKKLEHQWRLKVRDALIEYFPMDELQLLASDFDINLDDFGAMGRAIKVLKLIEYLDNRHKGRALVEAIIRAKPEAAAMLGLPQPSGGTPPRGEEAPMRETPPPADLKPPTTEMLVCDISIVREPNNYLLRLECEEDSGVTRFQLPFTSAEMAGTLAALRARQLPAADGLALGRTLWNCAFRGGEADTAAQRWHVAADRARRAHQKLLMRFNLTHVPELALWPWELLYIDDTVRFPALSPWTPIVRTVDVSAGRRRPPERALTLLGVTAAPEDQPLLDTARERRLLAQALEPLAQTRIVWQQRGTFADLPGMLHTTSPTVFHFMGHGSFNPHLKHGTLSFETKQGKPDPVDDSTLAQILGEATVQLAVLNACEGASSDEANPFAGVAWALARRGLDVLAMQFPVSDDAAIRFVATFYAALARRELLPEAVSLARQALYAEQRNTLEWATPTLVLQRSD